jgi:hypothetical protein
VEARADLGPPVRAILIAVAFYSIVTVKAPDREDEIKRIREVGPGRVSVEAVTPLPNGFLAVSLAHRSSAGKRFGYTTIVTKPEDDGGFSVSA